MSQCLRLLVEVADGTDRSGNLLLSENHHRWPDSRRTYRQDVLKLKFFDRGDEKGHEIKQIKLNQGCQMDLSIQSF